jgi:hypothetical protein
MHLSPGWMNTTADLTPYRGKNVELKFLLSNSSTSNVFLAVDDVTVTTK